MSDQSFGDDMDVDRTETAITGDSGASPASATTVRKEIEDWIKENTYVHVSIKRVTETPEKCVQLGVGPQDTIVHVYANDNWQPQFMMTDNSLVEDYVQPLNVQLQDQLLAGAPMAFTSLLHMFALSFAEVASALGPPSTSSSSSSSSSPFSFSSYRSPPSTPSHWPPPAPLHVPTTPAAATPEGEDAAPIEPTSEDWHNLIYPAVRQQLMQENFQPYEIDEWLRRVQVQVHKGDINKALSLVQHEILGGSPAPEAIAPFFRRRHRYYTNQSSSANNANTDPLEKYLTSGGTSEAVARLKSELIQLKEINSAKDRGFTAEPSGKDLFHWHIRISGSSFDTKTAQDLTEWAIRNTQISDTTPELDQDVLVEAKFPPDFPHNPPLFRIIRPRFHNVEVDLTPAAADDNANNNSNYNSSINDNTGGNEMNDNDYGRHSLTMSRALERSRNSWAPGTSVPEIAMQIRQFIMDSGATVDLESGTEGYSLPTFGGFWKSFQCQSPSSFGKADLENGGKILLPTSVLEDLTSGQEDNEDAAYSTSSFGRFSGLGRSTSSAGSTPMIFEISGGERGKRSFCGVEEFTAPEGQVIVPQWILNNLHIKKPGTTVQIRRVALPKGTFLKLQPHTADFLEVNDTKAMLEWVLPKFVALSVGDTIVIPYRNKKYPFNVLEVKPGRAVSIIDSEITTEFAPPLAGDATSYAQAQTLTQPDTATNTSTTTTTATTATSTATAPSSTTTTPTSPAKGETVGRLSVTSDQKEGVDFKTCDNCRQRIPIAAYTMHSLSCARMNWYCDSCGVVVQKSQKEQHIAEQHAPKFCECGASVESRLMAAHKENDCPLRIVTCSYCPLEMPYRERYEHEQMCGAQTQKCDTCHKYITKKDLLVHIVECAEEKQRQSNYQAQLDSYRQQQQQQHRQQQQPQQHPYSPVSPRAQSDDVLICPVCMQPFMQLDDLQVHQLTEHSTDHNTEGGRMDDAHTTTTAETTGTKAEDTTNMEERHNSSNTDEDLA